MANVWNTSGGGYMRLAPDATMLKSIQATLGAAGVVTTVSIPSGAVGANIRPNGDVRFNIDADPEAQATSSATTIAADALNDGNSAFADQDNVILFNPDAATLRLKAVAGGEVVTLEFFG